MTPVVGKLYRVTVGGRTLPNLYRYARSEPLHCQLHGEWYGTAWIMQKRRNSEVRPWGTLVSFDSATTTLEEVET